MSALNFSCHSAHLVACDQTPQATHLLLTQAAWLLQHMRLSQYKCSTEKYPRGAVVECGCACVLQIQVSGLRGAGCNASGCSGVARVL